MTIKTKLIIFLSIFATSSSSFAIVNCTGTIQSSYFSNSGDVVIYPSWSNKYHKVCNVNSEWKSVSAETCKTWTSVIIAAKLAKGPIRIQYGSENTCDVPEYAAAPAPSYLMLDI